ncbi:DnaD domain-containing protein [Halobacillus massiliensis]|uniref:DnaD domain-containing protein n=1 Tax=Halobacillus massiliensis TaxID=1926286 RepID=UPI00117BBCCC|nr:DnaD domain protein [Halobacillus massiliensis]
MKKYSLSLIKRKVDQLVKEDRLKIEDTELGTLFTVVNYSSYQGFDNYKSDNENAERTARERSENSNGTQRERSENNNKNVIKDIKVIKNDEEDTRAENPHFFYEQNFGMLKPFISESITQWADELSDELVLASMKLALNNNKQNFNYCEAILKDWQAKGVKTLEDARNAQRAFTPKKKSNVTPIRPAEKQYNYGF